MSLGYERLGERRRQRFSLLPNYNKIRSQNHSEFHKRGFYASVSEMKSQKYKMKILKLKISKLKAIYWTFIFVLLILNVVSMASYYYIFDECYVSFLQTYNSLSNTFLIQRISFFSTQSKLLILVLKNQISIKKSYNESEEQYFAQDLPRNFLKLSTVTDYLVKNIGLELCDLDNGSYIYAMDVNDTDISKSKLIFGMNDSILMWTDLYPDGTADGYPYQGGTVDQDYDGYYICNNTFIKCNSNYFNDDVYVGIKEYPTLPVLSISYSESCSSYYYTKIFLELSDIFTGSINDSISHIGLFNSSGNVISLTGNDTGYEYINDVYYYKSYYHVTDDLWKSVTSDKRFVTFENFTLNYILSGERLKLDIKQFSVFGDMKLVTIFPIYNIFGSSTEFPYLFSIFGNISFISLILLSISPIFIIYCISCSYSHIQENRNYILNVKEGSFVDNVCNPNYSGEESIYTLRKSLNQLQSIYDKYDTLMSSLIKDLLGYISRSNSPQFCSISDLSLSSKYEDCYKLLMSLYSQPYICCDCKITDALKTPPWFDKFVKKCSFVSKCGKKLSQKYYDSVYFLNRLSHEGFRIDGNAHLALRLLNLVWHLSLASKQSVPNSLVRSMFILEEDEYNQIFNAVKLEFCDTDIENIYVKDIVLQIANELSPCLLLQNHLPILCNQIPLTPNPLIGNNPSNRSISSYVMCVCSVILICCQSHYLLEKVNGKEALEKYFANVNEKEFNDMNSIYGEALRRAYLDVTTCCSHSK